MGLIWFHVGEADDVGGVNIVSGAGNVGNARGDNVNIHNIICSAYVVDIGIGDGNTGKQKNAGDAKNDGVGISSVNVFATSDVDCAAGSTRDEKAQIL
ncbi:hypothetical protein FSARC_13628 [Fusarium sarcochroum]|uniref:Uncharacterized protein n=1 Tax=Fusarium sarcochroum TaxID=1208366 RepID=A0A8H4SZY9_9HYPO|nr:hypothetical protein FSARC_13628 [Fusarium sarcochroum]